MNRRNSLIKLNIIIISTIILFVVSFNNVTSTLDFINVTYVAAQDNIIGITSDEEQINNLNNDSELDITSTNSVASFKLTENQSNEIKEQESVKLTNGYKISIDNQYVIYTSDLSYYNNAIDNILRVNLSDSAFQAYKLTGNIPPFVKDEKYYTEYYQSSDVEITSGEYDEQLLIDNTNAIQYYILNGTDLPQYDTVDEQTSVIDIANKHDLTPDELYLNNPGLDENSLVESGRQIIVNKPNQIINYTANYESTEERVIEYQTFTQPTEELLINEQQITQYGEDGLESLSFMNVEINGNLVGQTVTNNTVLHQPQNMIIQVGTKQLPDVGTGTFIWPEDCKTVTNGYLGYAGHTAIDIQCGYGGNIYAIDNGVVETSGYSTGGYGNYVVINHNNGFKSLYGHMAQLPEVNVGDIVYQGQVIGFEGNTGRSTGHHLHLEIMLTDSTNQNVISKPNPCNYYDYC